MGNEIWSNSDVMANAYLISSQCSDVSYAEICV